MAVTFELIVILVIFAGGVLGIWWRVEARIDRGDALLQKQLATQLKAIEDRREEILLAQKDLADYKLKAAQDFASVAHMKDVELRLATAIDRLTNRIEGLPRQFAEQVAQIIAAERAR